MSQINLVVGVDQTGAAQLGGLKAKPLPCALARRTRNGEWTVRALAFSGRKLSLASFDGASIERACEDAGWPGAFGTDSMIVVDCVLGLPYSSGASEGVDALWALFAEAARDVDARSGFGRVQAETFFSELAHRRGFGSGPPFPARACEARARANSVFQARPYQKNVQCGTYRIWRDLGRSLAIDGARWTRFGWFEDFETGTGPWTFEAFPSLLWRSRLGLATRDRARLKSALVKSKMFNEPVHVSKEDWLALEKSSDWADAAVLALTGASLAQNGQWNRMPELEVSRLRQEGWILGLDQKQLAAR